MKDNSYQEKKDMKIKELSPFAEAFKALAEWKDKNILDIALTKGGIAIACPPIADNAKKIVTIVANDEDLNWTNDLIKMKNLSEKVKVLGYDDKMADLQQEIDIVTFYGSLHHTDPDKALALANKNLKNGGKVVIFDGFFPERAREVYTVLSKIADPTNRLHLTYHEVVNAVRNNGFDIVNILPIQYKASLKKTIMKYPEAIRAVINDIFQKNESIKQQMGMNYDEALEDWLYFYELFVMLAIKGKPNVVEQH